MIEIQPSTKTLICIGTGGVGKTTLAATIGYGESLKNKKVLVLTIDPSQRLAQLLGIQKDGEVHEVTPTFFAATLNSEKIFDEFIDVSLIKSSGNSNSLKNSDEEIQKIKNNKLFNKLKTQLNGSQDFTALYKLNQVLKSQKYDLVILDTPPAQHTLNFLQAPEKLSKLFNDQIAQWFRSENSVQNNSSDLGSSGSQKKSSTSFFNPSGLFSKIVNFSTQQVLKILEMLTGAEFIKELSLFFEIVQKWQTPILNEISESQRILMSKQTEFLLVTALDPSRLKEATDLGQTIHKQGYNLKHLVFNRALNFDWGSYQAPQNPSEDLKQLMSYFADLEKTMLAAQPKLSHFLKVYKSPEIVQNEVQIEKQHLQAALSQKTMEHNLYQELRRAYESIQIQKNSTT